MDMTYESYQDTLAELKAASASYYSSDILEMDDAEFDAKMGSLREWEEKNPTLVGPDSLTSVVGGAGGEITHQVKMLSLDNVFSPEEMSLWLSNAGSEVEWVMEPKLDGLAVSIRYTNGRVVHVATRGDGESGENVSHALSNLKGVGNPVGFSGEIRGEVVLTQDQLQIANQSRTAHGDKPFANARNGAAGALRGQDRAYAIEMSFFAYGIADESRDHTEVLTFLRESGFGLAYDIIDHSDDLLGDIVKLGTNRSELGLDTDGAVVKANKASDRKTLGVSSRAPKWAIAYKYPADMVFSELLEVNWQVGRTGVITPRGSITPVSVGGVTITYATLHNPADIARKGFMMGDTVSVYRAGEVVPRIEAPVIEKRDGTQTEIELPTCCPDCGGAIDKSEVRWRCEKGRGCSAEAGLVYACSRDALDIEGLGGKHIKTLVEQGLASNVADLFDLGVKDLAGLDRLGETSAKNIIDQITAAKEANLGRVITCLGIRGTGRSLSRRLAGQFGSLEALMGASEVALREVDGIGEEKAVLIHSEFNEVRDIADRLIAAGMGAGEVHKVAPVGALAGKKVCVSGSVPGMSRNEANEAVERLGGKSVGSVSKNTDLLVAGPGAGSKEDKAHALGIAVMSSDDFAKLVA